MAPLVEIEIRVFLQCRIGLALENVQVVQRGLRCADQRYRWREFEDRLRAYHSLHQRRRQLNVSLPHRRIEIFFNNSTQTMDFVDEKDVIWFDTVGQNACVRSPFSSQECRSARDMQCSTPSSGCNNVRKRWALRSPEAYRSVARMVYAARFFAWNCSNEYTEVVNCLFAG